MVMIGVKPSGPAAVPGPVIAHFAGFGLHGALWVVEHSSLSCVMETVLSMESVAEYGWMRFCRNVANTLRRTAIVPSKSASSLASTQFHENGTGAGIGRFCDITR